MTAVDDDVDEVVVAVVVAAVVAAVVDDDVRLGVGALSSLKPTLERNNRLVILLMHH